MSRNKLNIYIYYLILFLVYTQGFWERFTTFPVQSVLEISVLLLAVLSFKPLFTPQFCGITLVFSIGLISALATSTFIPYLKSFRFMLYFFFIYNALWNTNFTIREFNNLLRFLVALILLQGIASVYQAFIIGQRVEGYVGLMSSIGGTTATAFPVFITGLLFVILFYCNNNLKNKIKIILLICFLSVCLVGYSSTKRAIFFLIPFIILLSMIIVRIYYAGPLINLWKKYFIFVIIAIIGFPIYIIGITNTHGLNYGISGRESNIDKLKIALSYVTEYETAQSGGLSIGRTGSTKNIINQALESAEYFFIGSGFGTIKDEGIKSDREVGYGIVGVTRDIFSGGMIYALFVIWFYFLVIFYTNNKSKDYINIYKVLRLIVLFIFLIIHLGYSSDFTVSLKITVSLALLLCLLNSDKYFMLRNYYKTFFYN